MSIYFLLKSYEELFRNSFHAINCILFNVNDWPLQKCLLIGLLYDTRAAGTKKCKRQPTVKKGFSDVLLPHLFSIRFLHVIGAYAVGASFGEDFLG